MAGRNSLQFSPMQEQVPNNPRMGIEFPLGLLQHLPQQEMTSSPVAPNENDDNFLKLFRRVYVESLND